MELEDCKHTLDELWRFYGQKPFDAEDSNGNIYHCETVNKFENMIGWDELNGEIRSFNKHGMNLRIWKPLIKPLTDSEII